MPSVPFAEPPGARGPDFDRTPTKCARLLQRDNPRPGSARAGNSAVVYCEANFGAIDGKTANGLVRHSEKYEILSVIDSQKSGLDAGEVLGDKPNGIPICADLAGAIALAGAFPTSSSSGWRPPAACSRLSERRVMLDAIGSRDEHRQRASRVPERRPGVRGGS